MSQLVQRHAGILQLAFVIGIVGLAIVVSASLEPDATASRAAAVPASTTVTAVEPAAVRFIPTIELNGIVEPRTMTSIVPQVSGRVVEVSRGFRSGAYVREGDLLFVIDPADYELAVARTLAEIEAARSDLALLEAEAAAERQVWASQFPDRPIPDLTARVPQIAAARARIHSAEAARDAAELQLSRTVVSAPFDARVLMTQLDEGQVVGPGIEVGTLFAIDGVEVKLPVSASELKRIGRLDGREVRIITAAGSRLQGRVARMAAALDERTRLASLFIAPADPASLTASEFVTVEIEGEAAPAAYRVPASAFASRDGLWVVDNGRIVQRQVDVLGYESDAAIVAPFDAAAGVVMLPPPNVRAGLPVTVARPDSVLAGGGPARAAD